MDDPSLPIWLSICLVLSLVVLNGFFVAAEFAMVKIRGSRIESLAQEGSKMAEFAKSIVANLNAYLTACQLGITLTSLGLGWIGGPAIAHLLKPLLTTVGVSDSIIQTLAFVLAFAIIVLLHITIGVQLPKTHAIRKPEKVALWSSGPMRLFYVVLFPFIWFFNTVSNWLLKKFELEPEAEYESVHTEEEIRILVKESHRSGLIDNTELTLVDNIFEFTETNAREIMIPRMEMACLYTTLSYEENKRIAVEGRHTRFPVCDPDKDNVIGFVHIKDMLEYNDQIEDIRAITRPLINVPDSMPISDLLRMLQKKRTEMALLIDEYGGTSGLVTIEDILEEIVGEIHDEFDEDRPRIEQVDALTYSIDGLLLIDEVNSFFGTNVENEDFDTIGGWVYAQVDMPPRPNQQVHYAGFEFVVEEVEHMRIARVSITIPAEYALPLQQEVS